MTPPPYNGFTVTSTACNRFHEFFNIFSNFKNFQKFSKIPNTISILFRTLTTENGT